MDETVALIITVASDVLMWALIGLAWWLMGRMDLVNLLKKQGEVYRHLAALHIGRGQEKVRYKERTYLLKGGGYLKGSRVEYHIDIDTGKILNWGQPKGAAELHPEDTDTFLSRKLLHSIADLLKPQSKELLLMILLPIVCLVIGLVLGYLLHGGGTVIQQITENHPENYIPIIPVT